MIHRCGREVQKGSRQKPRQEIEVIDVFLCELVDYGGYSVI